MLKKKTQQFSTAADKGINEYYNCYLKNNHEFSYFKDSHVFIPLTKINLLFQVTRQRLNPFQVLLWRLLINIHLKNIVSSFVGALIMTRTDRGVALTSLCNVKTFISIQRCKHFLPRSCTDEGRVGPLREVTSYILKIFDGVKIWTVVTMCENDVLYYAHVSLIKY